MVLVILVVYLFCRAGGRRSSRPWPCPFAHRRVYRPTGAWVSINTLTLFGMVLAIGIVVDDAIVVVENVERHMNEGAIAQGCGQKSHGRSDGSGHCDRAGPVRSICAGGFPGGITGELYKQFAITIAIAVVISGFVALTLSPALCALVLKPGHGSCPRILRTFQSRVRLDQRPIYLDRGRYDDQSPLGSRDCSVSSCWLPSSSSG